MKNIQEKMLPIPILLKNITNTVIGWLYRTGSERGNLTDMSLISILYGSGKYGILALP